MYQKFGIKKEILDLSEEVEKEIQPIFKNIEKIEERKLDPYTQYASLISISRMWIIRNAFKFINRIWN